MLIEGLKFVNDSKNESVLRENQQDWEAYIRKQGVSSLVNYILDKKSCENILGIAEPDTFIPTSIGTWSGDSVHIVNLPGNQFDETTHYPHIMDQENLFLINHSKKQYLSMEKYIAQEGIGFDFFNNGELINILHPIVFLLLDNSSVDTKHQKEWSYEQYNGPDSKFVGSWAHDSISASFFKPEDSYKEILPYFTSNGNFKDPVKKAQEDTFALISGDTFTSVFHASVIENCVQEVTRNKFYTSIRVYTIPAENYNEETLFPGKSDPRSLTNKEFIQASEEFDGMCYTLEDFQADFNDECISDQNYIRFI